LELHDLKLLLQQHFRDGLLTIVGSGLSCAEGLPGMTVLADYLVAKVGVDLTDADREIWEKLCPIIQAKGLEPALLEIGLSPSLESAIAATTAELFVESQRQIVTEVFEGKRTLRFTRLLRHLLKPTSGLPVVTTNYDCLVEIAVEEAGLGVDTMFVGYFAGELNEQESKLSFCREVTLRGKQIHWRYRPRVNVYKPHGSLEWYHREGRPVRYGGDLKAQRLIIMPGLNKFRNGYQSPFDRHRERAISSIDGASRFLAIGYGFNDDHLQTHLTPRIRSGTPTLILAYELSQNATKLADECGNVIALERATLNGEEGTLAIVDRKKIPLPGLSLWDLNSFVSEVLEP
jgi:hypothetical protein